MLKNRKKIKRYNVRNKFNIIDPHLDFEVEIGGDNSFSIFQDSKSKFTV